MIQDYHAASVTFDELIEGVAGIAKGIRLIQQVLVNCSCLNVIHDRKTGLMVLAVAVIIHFVCGAYVEDVIVLLDPEAS